MVLVKLLKRNDASSVIVAVVAALVLVQFLTVITIGPAHTLSGSNGSAGFGGSLAGDWRQAYLQPFIATVLSFVAFELLVRLVLWIKSALNRK